MNKRLFNNKGLTLIELLAATVLFAIIAIFVASLIFKSTEATTKIQAETAMRDEADLIMSNFIRTMYETKKSDIISFENTGNSNFLKVTNDPTKCQRDENGNLPSTCNGTLMKTGFETVSGVRKLFLNNEEYKVSDSNITILPDSNMIENSDGTYGITLRLQFKFIRGGKEVIKTMDFNNTIQPF